MAIADRIPIWGTLRKQGQMIEAARSVIQDLEEDVKDWQAIGKQAEAKDVDWTDYKKNHEDCWAAYVENPLAKGYVDRLIDFVIKEGFEVISEDTRTQDTIDRLQKDWEWLSFQVQCCRESAIYGELFGRFFDTDVILVDPSSISAIRTDPLNVKQVEEYLHEYETQELDSHGKPTTKTAHEEWIPAGEMIHKQFNTVSTAKRGISDLLCVLKWLTRHKEVATNLVRRTNIQSSVVIEKIIKGPGISSSTVGGWKESGDEATSTYSGKRMERAWKPGTALVHTENVEYNFTELPNDVRGMVELLVALLKIILAGLGFSEAWLGNTAESNLATSQSVELPILAKLERRQYELQGFFERLFTKALENEGITSPEFDIVVPELSDEDAKAFAESFKALAEGLVVATDNEWISDETASKALGDPVNQYESYEEEIKKIEEQIKKKQEEEAKNKLEYPEMAGPITPPLTMAPPALALQQAFSEVETKFQKKAMDNLMNDYAQALVDSWKKARDKIMPVVEKAANEKRGPSGSEHIT